MVSPMADRRNAVVRKMPHLTNVRAKELAAEGITAAVRSKGKEALARASDMTTRAVEKWMAEVSLPQSTCCSISPTLPPKPCARCWQKRAGY